MRPTHPSIQQAELKSRIESAEQDTMKVSVDALPAGLSGFEARLAALEQMQAKAFGRFTTVASPVLQGTSYNVTSVSKTSTGVYAVVIGTDMTTTDYTIILSYEDSTATIFTLIAGNIATTGFDIALRDSSNSLSDASESVSFVIYENNT